MSVCLSFFPFSLLLLCLFAVCSSLLPGCVCVSVLCSPNFPEQKESCFLWVLCLCVNSECSVCSVSPGNEWEKGEKWNKKKKKPEWVNEFVVNSWYDDVFLFYFYLLNFIHWQWVVFPLDYFSFLGQRFYTTTAATFSSSSRADEHWDCPHHQLLRLNCLTFQGLL